MKHRLFMDKQPDIPDLFFISSLIERHIRGELGRSGQEQLDAWLQQDEDNRRYFAYLTEEKTLKGNLRQLGETDIPEGWAALREKMTAAPAVVVPVRRRQWWKYAAVFLPLAAVAGFFLLRQQKQPAAPQNTSIATRYHNDVRPASKKAVLVLGNGKKVLLDDHAHAQLTEKDGLQVRHDSDRLVYEDKAAAATKDVLYNTLIIPAGGTYEVVLADGSHVWLNARSSLRYPTRFAGNDRTVYLSGEAYFEVNKDPHQPFIVQTEEGVRIQVLGTHFNVMAYDNERKVVTTLLQGRVKLQSSGGAGAYDLHPGYQAVFNRDRQRMQIGEADTEAAIAWKNGLFLFNNEELPVIMRRLARWYDVEVEYRGNGVQESHFTGAIRRKENISKVLEMLELTGGAHFEITGSKITVAP